MPHVEIEAAAIPQKTAVARRLLVVAIVQVNRADARLAKGVIFHADRPRVRTAG